MHCIVGILLERVAFRCALSFRSRCDGEPEQLPCPRVEYEKIMVLSRSGVQWRVAPYDNITVKCSDEPRSRSGVGAMVPC